MKKSLNASNMEFGVCYYPEHWDRDLWENDFKRMREMGISIIRIGEFAWSIFEPSDGVFVFDFFDEVIELAGKYNLSVIFGTPTATPPAWLTHAHPEVLNVTHDGVQYQHGHRRHYNYNAPIYRVYCRRIVDQIARRYSRNPVVIGWQIDNELNCETNNFYSKADHEAFRRWLQVKYRTLTELNRAWGAVFWNQTYTTWDEVHLTRPNPSNSVNPHQALDEKRFFSDSAISFAREQAEIIRSYSSTQFITTNGIFGHLDTAAMTKQCLDFISYDSYPNFGNFSTDGLKDRKWGANLSVARGISPNFCVMEQQSGPGGWVDRIEQATPKPGQLRLWTYQSIAHGADMVVYFRWRTANIGTEIYWHGIHNYDNRENRRYREIRQTISEITSLSEKLASTQHVADVALVNTYDNEWDGEADNWHGPYDHESFNSWYTALQTNHVPCDVLYINAQTRYEDIANYRTLVFPHPTLIDESTVQLLLDYVNGGGTLILGCRAGYKDLDGHCRLSPMPGPFAQLAGIQVEDFTRVQPPYELTKIRCTSNSGNVSICSGPTFNEVLELIDESVQVLGIYENQFYAGQPALTSRKVRDGRVIYCGSVFSNEIIGFILAELNIESPNDMFLEIPSEVELAIRQNEHTNEKYVFLLNYSPEQQEITLSRTVVNVLESTTISGTLTIEPFGVKVIQSVPQ